jgi:hypothetical protein
MVRERGLGVHQGRDVAVALPVPHDRLEYDLQPPLRLRVLRDRPRERLADALLVMHAQGLQHIVPVGEVAVERGPGHARLLADVADRQLARTAQGERAQCAVEDPVHSLVGRRHDVLPALGLSRFRCSSS